MKSWMYCAAALLAAPVLFLANGGSAGNERYQSPPTAPAAEVLPPELLRGPHHKIPGSVEVDGFLDRYRMQTKWGTFTVEGNELLRQRVREADATAKLEGTGNAEAAVDAAGRAALAQIETAKDFVSEPMKTLGKKVQGVGGWLGRLDSSVLAKDAEREEALASLTGASKARRKLAFDLGVDPYSTFPPLQRELTRVANASAIGDTAANIGLGVATGGAGIAVDVGEKASGVRQALRDKTAGELERTGRELLAGMGVSEATIAAFYANSSFTPTDKAVIVEALASLGEADGIEAFVARAAEASSESEGFAYRRKAQLTAAYHRRISPVRSFVRAGSTPVMETDDGLIAIVPVDYVYWSPELASFASDGGEGQLWITGTASTRAEEELESRGWTVVTSASRRLER
jgi:hypothetical protein